LHEQESAGTAAGLKLGNGVHSNWKACSN